MTRDEIKQMALDSGMFGGVPEMEGATISERIERFAHLVEQRTIEECARICEERLKVDGLHSNFLCAKFIRATSTLQASKVEVR